MLENLDTIIDTTKAELNRSSEALAMLFDLFPDAEDPAVTDDEGDEDDEGTPRKSDKNRVAKRAPRARS